MKIREWPAALDRVQHGRVFKIAASVVLALLTVGGFTAYAVRVTSTAVDPVTRVFGELTAEEAANPQFRSMAALVTQAGSGITAVGLGLGVALLVGLAVIWLGFALSGLGVALLAAGVAAGFYAGESTTGVVLVLGSASLTLSFVALLQSLRAAFGAHTPVFAVARNVLAEAVRMKISIVFIVLLIIGLATLPSLMDENQPLRYRVQSFLQYGSGVTFWTLALLTVLFSVSSVAGEQRDKVIWHTVTKPVAPWQYVLGKWLGVAGLNAVLLLVSASGVFLFTEYLRAQPALNEVRAYVGKDGTPTEDRIILESQILTARVTVSPLVPPEFARDGENFREIVERRIENERTVDPNFGQDESTIHKLEDDLHKQLMAIFRTVPPDQLRWYLFEGLERAGASGRPITLEYRIDAGGNRPDELFPLTFVLQSGDRITRRTGPGFTHTLPVPADAINEEGQLAVGVINGAEMRTAEGDAVIVPNEVVVTFPEEGLAVSYSAGSFRMNFFRVALVLWVKLAFIGMVAVWAATFLSFPVASLVSMGVFLLAESASFLSTAADLYGTTDQRNNFQLHRALTTPVAAAVGKTFGVYAGLSPIERLVQGKLLAWSTVAFGTAVLIGLTAVFYGLAVMIFRKRELAIYSGQ